MTALTVYASSFLPIFMAFSCQMVTSTYFFPIASGTEGTMLATLTEVLSVAKVCTTHVVLGTLSLMFGVMPSTKTYSVSKGWPAST